MDAINQRRFLINGRGWWSLVEVYILFLSSRISGVYLEGLDHSSNELGDVCYEIINGSMQQARNVFFKKCANINICPSLVLLWHENCFSTSRHSLMSSHYKCKGLAIGWWRCSVMGVVGSRTPHLYIPLSWHTLYVGVVWIHLSVNWGFVTFMRES